jgi:hypothetical protein
MGLHLNRDSNADEEFADEELQESSGGESLHAVFSLLDSLGWELSLENLECGDLPGGDVGGLWMIDGAFQQIQAIAHN